MNYIKNRKLGGLNTLGAVSVNQGNTETIYDNLQYLNLAMNAPYAQSNLFNTNFMHSLNTNTGNTGNGNYCSNGSGNQYNSVKQDLFTIYENETSESNNFNPQLGQNVLLQSMIYNNNSNNTQNDFYFEVFLQKLEIELNLHLLDIVKRKYNIQNS